MLAVFSITHGDTWRLHIQGYKKVRLYKNFGKNEICLISSQCIQNLEGSNLLEHNQPASNLHTCKKI